MKKRKIIFGLEMIFLILFIVAVILGIIAGK